MRRRRTVLPTSAPATAVGLVGLLVAALVLAGAPAAQADDSAHALAVRVDQERAAHGLPPLTHVADLHQVAQESARSIAAAGRLFHDPALSQRVSGWSRLTENVAFSTDVASVHAALMASAGHRANILDPGVSQIGVGTVWAGGRLWVSQVFRSPTGAAVGAEPVALTPAFAPPAACTGSPAAPFADVPRGAWYAAAVDCAVAAELVRGVTSSSYAPDRPVSRAQLATLLHRIVLRSGSAAAAAGAPDAFGDDQGSPHEPAIDAMAHLGLLEGTGPGTFSPHAPVTRAQTAALLVRLHERLVGPMASSGAAFTDTVGSVHAEAIDKAATAQIMPGTSPSAFSPQVAVHRDLTAVVLVRTWAGLRQAGAVG